MARENVNFDIYIEQKCNKLLCVSLLFFLPFTITVSSAFREREILAEVQYFLFHTIALPGDSAPISDLLACLLWPMIRKKRNHFGKPVEVWCNCVFAPAIFKTAGQVL